MIDEKKPIFSLQDGIVSPRFIASADIHLGHKIYNIPECEKDLEDSFVRLCDLAISKKVPYLVICGDLFDTNRPEPYTITLVREQGIRLAEAGVQLIGIAGDHDKPIKGDSWCKVAGIKPITSNIHFAGFDYYDTSGGMDHVIEMLKDKRDPEQIYWIFLHCQFPQMFQFTDDKKKVDFSEVKVFENFPNLQGVIAGDIHAGPEASIIEKDRVAYIGYCGSLGVMDISEAGDKNVIYCDGYHLYRVPFLQRRPYVRINFRGDNHKSFHADIFVNQYKNAVYRPVFRIDWDGDSEPYLSKLKPLYNLGYVRPHQTIRDMKTGKEQEIASIRSEMKTEDKIDATLKVCCNGDQQLLSLLSDGLKAADPKIVLDEFKEKVFS